ncbi:hypothetical protein Kpol_1036p57 [Vanderwaltozyma polyspora DSM 70294]|uniref:UDENN domain-containing protein n=1 Tax=Vanderwaltozyma polyspora (strain ATCC 22028 / DSM 70294 / BCRC 21397 / CBS 2163 / NBRC 10782 / NRRL Y-8283 / UCD 57-17) TaxID=436907 RepID=A7TEK5_VANPO|nr:uncharacterized protein Kpol_1036p57 [Vanderwaltozyma polyspora DSM 70294]EDO19312.1 hypothetical protein Kpol_1036p57 [Vanderwaltozyma polyspora DSM 70294]
MNINQEVIVGVGVVDFHHTRGPEVEYWHGLPEGTDESTLWPNLPFQALPDGSHSFKETFTYFTLLFNPKTKTCPQGGATGLTEEERKECTTLFAVSCSQQISSEELLHKDKEVTRSTVQKAIVVVSYQPIFGQIRDKLSIVTNVFFSQKNFTDRSIIVSLYDNLQSLFKPMTSTSLSDSNMYVGLCLRKIILDFKKETLVLFKALFLEKKIIFYGNNVESLCNLQFGLISLIPNLISNLQNSGSPMLHKDVSDIKVVTSFKSSDRASVLTFMGFPLHIFETGGFFSPYTPLQQINDINDEKSKFFVIGTSNSLLSERKDELCQIYVDTDNFTIEIIDKSLQPLLQLTANDKKWIESMSNVVSESWNENDRETPKNSQFEGSEDFIRWQFEDYLIGLLSSVKLHDYLENHKNNEKALMTVQDDMIHANPINLFNISWVNEWKKTQSFSIFNKVTDDRIFDLFPPKHVFNGPDPFKAFQQKFIATFQNLKKNNSSNSSLSDEKKQKNEKKDSESLSRTSTTSSSHTNHTKDFSNRWMAFKELFNKKKNSSQENDIHDLKSKADQHLLDEESDEDNTTGKSSNGSDEESSDDSSGDESSEETSSDDSSDDNDKGSAVENQGPSIGLGLHYITSESDNSKSEEPKVSEEIATLKLTTSDDFKSMEDEELVEVTSVPNDIESVDSSVTKKELIESSKK